MSRPLQIARDVLDQTFAAVGDAFQRALPLVLEALLTLAGAYVTITVVLWLLRRALTRLYPAEQTLVADLLVTVVKALLWFGVALAVLSILGLGGIAASLGTATGFVALGVAYALSEMIEDTVAGVYLLRDPDFEYGDRVEAADVTGTVRAIELRKCRLETDDGDVVVLANRKVESRWRKRGGEP